MVIFFWQLNIDDEVWLLCQTWFYLLMQSAQVFTVIIFIVSGLYIRKSILSLQPHTSSEQKFVSENKERALRQIQICLMTLVVYSVYNMLYSLSLRFFAPDCTKVFLDHKGMNNFLWFMSRGMSDYFWTYPFIYLFWPKAVKMTLRKSK